VRTPRWAAAAKVSPSRFEVKAMQTSATTVQRGTAPGKRGSEATGAGLPLTGRVARAAARHPWRVLGLWVVLLVAAFAAAGTMNLAVGAATAGTESTRASDLIDARLREETPPEEFIVVESAGETADEPAYAAFVD